MEEELLSKQNNENEMDQTIEEEIEQEIKSCDDIQIDEDFRLIFGINYYKILKSENKKYSLIPLDLSIILFDWKKKVQINEAIYVTYQEIYKQTTNHSFEQIDGEILNFEEKNVINPLKKLIETYNIKRVYIYGFNYILRRLFKNFPDIHVYFHPSIY